ncbi:MAG: VanZ family protein [Firmicutes bacterium]|nr:VanZ family protein [Bacillota bacterium]
MQYKKYGAISIYRVVIVFSFAFYVLCAYYLVILPLPNPETLKPLVSIFNHMQLIPFKFVYQFAAYTKLHLTDIHTYLPALKQSVFIQPFFNLLLTVPFGFYLGYYFKKSIKETVLYTFLLSVFFEITQLTALYGVYPRPYRLFDVDDLMLNTLGGLVGFEVYKHILFFLPSREKIDKSAMKKSESVGVVRRLFAFGADFYIVSFVSSIIARFARISGLPALLLFHLLLFLYCVLLQIAFKQTIGQKLTRLKLRIEGGEYKAIFVRNTVLILALFSLNLLNFIIKTAEMNLPYIIALQIIVTLILFDALMSLRKGKRLFHDRISKTEYISARGNS